MTITAAISSSPGLHQLFSPFASVFQTWAITDAHVGARRDVHTRPHGPTGAALAPPGVKAPEHHFPGVGVMPTAKGRGRIFLT